MPVCGACVYVQCGVKGEGSGPCDMTGTVFSNIYTLMYEGVDVTKSVENGVERGGLCAIVGKNGLSSLFAEEHLGIRVRLA